MTTRRPRSVLAAGLLAAGFATSAAHGQFLDESLRAGTLPAGWTATEIDFQTGAGGYARFEETTSVLTSAPFDASAAPEIDVRFAVAKWGSGDDGPLTLEYSLDGSEWLEAGNSSTPTSATYIDDTLTINASGEAMQIRFTRMGSPSRKRLRDVVVEAGGPDNFPPVIVALSPANDANDVPATTSLSAAFDEPVQAGTGEIRIFDALDTLVETFDVATGVDFAGDTVSFTPSSALPLSTTFHVQIDPGAITDTAPAENAFGGIDDKITWNFTTEEPDFDPPTVVGFTPPAGAALSGSPESYAITFDEDVLAGPGSITLFNAADDSVVESFDVDPTAFQVFVDGNEAMFFPIETLMPATSYYFTVDAGAFTDASPNENSFPGFTDAATWTFSRAAVPALDGVEPYTENFAGFVDETTFPLGWSFEGEVLGYNGDWGTGFSSGFRGNASVLGYQHTGSTGTLTKRLTLLNETGGEISDLTVSYVGRVERPTEGRSPAYVVTVAGIEVPGLAFSTDDGDNQIRQATVSGLAIPDGSVFEITWVSDRGFDGSGSSKQIGISDVSVDVGAETFPPSLAATVVDLLSVTSTSAEVSSEVQSDGGEALTGTGFVVAETAVNPDPELGGTGVTDLPDAAPAVGPFATGISGLAAGTGYSVRSYATNALGTTYSAVSEFSTLPPAPNFVETFTQDFDNFDGSFPLGWSGVSSGGSNGFAGDWGTGFGAGFRGNVANPGVLGYQHTGGSGTLVVSLRLINATGGVLDELNLSYLGRVERPDQGRSPQWTVAVNGTEIPELFYSTESAVDATAAAALGGLGIAADEEFEITWTSDRGEPGGASRQIGIADVVVSTEEIVLPDDDFGTWAAANGIVGEPFDGDFDGDGFPNGLEYALAGFNPAATDGGAAGTLADGVLSFTKRDEAVANGDVSYVIEQSTDLGVSDPWTAVTPDVNDATTISLTLPSGPGVDRVFVRLRVTQN